MKFNFAILTLLPLILASHSFANQMGPQGDQFYEEAAHFENACSNDDCKAPYSKKIIYDQSRRFDKLTALEKKALKAIAFEQAQIWGDTILEGDYIAAGRTRLDQVTAYYKNSTIVGYKIRYSEKAWSTGTCSYDGSNESLVDCTMGRIFEKSYVSPNMTTYFSDEDSYASFATTNP